MKIFSSILSSISTAFRRIGTSNKLKISCRLSVVLGRQGLKVKLNSSIKPSGKLSFLKKAIFKLRATFLSKAEKDLQIYFNKILKAKEKETLSQIQKSKAPLYMQFASYTNLLYGITGNLNKTNIEDIIEQIQDMKIKVEAHQSVSKLKLIMDIKAKGSKELLEKGIEAIKRAKKTKDHKKERPSSESPETFNSQKSENWGSLLNNNKTEDTSRIDQQYRSKQQNPSAPPMTPEMLAEYNLRKNQHDMPLPSAPPMTPEMLAEYNAKEKEAAIPMGIPVIDSKQNYNEYVPQITPISQRTNEQELQMDPVQALYFHIEHLQNGLSLFHSRVSYELQPSVNRLYETLQKLTKSSFKMMFEFKKGDQKIKLKSKKDTKKALMEISFYSSLKSDDDMFSKFMARTAIPKSLELLDSGSREYKLYKEALDQILYDILTGYAYQEIVHHSKQASQIINSFNQYGFPYGMQGLYEQHKNIDYKIKNILEILNNLQYLTAQLDDIIETPDQSLVPHLKEQLKQQLDYLTGIKQYHHTFEATFKSQYQAISEIVQSEDSQKS